MNSDDINTAVNISIIHVHFKALQHNKAVPISHSNSLRCLAFYSVDKMPFWMGWNTVGIVCLLLSMELQRIMRLIRYSLLKVLLGYLTKVSCRGLRRNGYSQAKHLSTTAT